MGLAWPPSLPIMAAVSFNPSGSRPAATTDTPARPSASADARPSPDAAPVTIAVFPSRLRLIELPSSGAPRVAGKLFRTPARGPAQYGDHMLGSRHTMCSEPV